MKFGMFYEFLERSKPSGGKSAFWIAGTEKCLLGSHLVNEKTKYLLIFIEIRNQALVNSKSYRGIKKGIIKEMKNHLTNKKGSSLNLKFNKVIRQN